MKIIVCICFITLVPLLNLAADEKAYSIGDRGPAGGLIFYDDEADGIDDIPDARYLEAATEIIMPREYVAWGSDLKTYCGADGTSVGTGKQNTATIIAKQGPNYSGAVQMCNDLEYGGFDDWFLPSKDELNLMYENLHKRGLGGFSDSIHDSYWSSSEDGPSKEVWSQKFNQEIYKGSQGKTNKKFGLIARAVRSFSVEADTDIDVRIIEAVENNQIDEVKRLLDSGTDIDSKDNFGNTALMSAAKMSSPEMVRIILAAGADVNAINKDGETALVYAAKSKINQSSEVFGILIEAGGGIPAVLNDSDVRYRTAPTTVGSDTLGYLHKGDRVIVLGQSKNEERIGNMSAPWYKIKTEDGTVGYGYGYFFDLNEDILPVVSVF